MRGSNTLFADIFETEPEKKVSQRKGRSSDLNAKRNECLIDRYYYYGKFYDKRYTSIIDTLSAEFFLSPVTIPEVISDNYIQLQQLKKSQPSKADFKNKWPHLVW